MEFNFQTLRFNATEKLVEYVNKKVAKLEKNPDIQTVDLTLKVVKPETANKGLLHRRQRSRSPFSIQGGWRMGEDKG